MLAQAIAASAAARSTLALPVSVVRKSRRGRCRLRAQAVRPERADLAEVSLIPGSLSPQPAPGLYAFRTEMSSRSDLPSIRVLSESQLAMLAEHGEERRAEVGEKLFEIGDRSYPFVAILEGEVAILDAAGREIVRHRASGFLGEMNLLSGQTVFLTAVVTAPLRYIAVDREVLRRLLFQEGSLSDLLLSAFVERRELLQQREGIGIEIVGPAESAETRHTVDFARRAR